MYLECGSMDLTQVVVALCISIAIIAIALSFTIDNKQQTKTSEIVTTNIPITCIYTDTIDAQRFIATQFTIGNNKYIMFKYGKDFEVIKE